MGPFDNYIGNLLTNWPNREKIHKRNGLLFQPICLVENHFVAQHYRFRYTYKCQINFDLFTKKASMALHSIDTFDTESRNHTLNKCKKSFTSHQSVSMRLQTN